MTVLFFFCHFTFFFFKPDSVFVFVQVLPATDMNWNKGGPSGKRGFGFGGFSLSGGKKEEPRLNQQSHSAFGVPGSAGAYGKNQQLPAFYKIGTKRANFDEENA